MGPHPIHRFEPPAQIPVAAPVVPKPEAILGLSPSRGGEPLFQRIIGHWTAGGKLASVEDREHYHYLVTQEPRVVEAVPVRNNLAPLRNNYAAHTLRCNTGSIGVAVCGMLGAKEAPFNAGPAPITLAQWNLFVRLIAELAYRHGVLVTPRTVLTHAEVQGTLGIAQRGKWDISILPFDPSFNTAKKVGDRLRAEVEALL